jgi:hypothetical protein
MTGTATYLYAITRPVPAAELAGLRGVGGAPVRAVEDGGLACLVSTVELAEFGEEALAANLDDLGWLERTARQHDEVVRAGAAMTTTMPLRLATICTDDTSARDRLVRLGASALAVLAGLDGRDEWGLKLFAAEPVGADAGAVAAGSSGTAYLQRRRHELGQRAAVAEAAGKDADAVYGRMAECAADARRHRPQDQRLSGVPHPMVLNAAFLVDRERAGEFRRAVAELAAERPPDSVVLTGPWPPYSFAAVAAT